MKKANKVLAKEWQDDKAKYERAKKYLEGEIINLECVTSSSAYPKAYIFRENGMDDVADLILKATSLLEDAASLIEP